MFALLHPTAHFTFIFIPGRFREKGNFYMETTGYIHSIDSFGSVDGPGVRFVTFLQAAICGAGIVIIRIRGSWQTLLPFPDHRPPKTQLMRILSKIQLLPSVIIKK